MYSKIIKNGQIIDGTGRKMFRADIAIEKDKIVLVDNLENSAAQEVIDAAGKYVTPGFIDIQNHSDVHWCLFDNPKLDSLIAQGITTILVGQCGASLAPLLSRDGFLAVQKWHDLEGVNLGWLTFGEYVHELSKRRFGANVASLAGHSTLRRGLISDQIRALSDSEKKIIQKNLQQSLDEGAFGMSSGLSYAHESNMAGDELKDLAKILAENDALFSIHLRSEAAALVESVAYAIDLAKYSGCNLKISHLKVRGKANWHLLPEALSNIENAYQSGVEVHFDVYPYDFTWQPLYMYLPQWSYESGRAMLLKYLADPQQRKKILAYLAGQDLNYSHILIASTANQLNITGRTLGQIAARQNTSPEQALLGVIEHGGSKVLVFEKNMDFKLVRTLLGHSLAMVVTDGAGFAFSKSVSSGSGAGQAVIELQHARSFGSMPKFLGMAIKGASGSGNPEFISIEKAVQKITSIPAAKMRLKGRGVIAPGYFADIVIFDNDINSLADYENPHQKPTGLDYVLVNGQSAVRDGEVQDKMFGRILRKG